MGDQRNDVQVAEAPGVKKKNEADTGKQPSALQVDQSRANEPLRECVRSAMVNYFNHLDGHSTSGLHRMVLCEVEDGLQEPEFETFSTPSAATLVAHLPNNATPAKCKS